MPLAQFADPWKKVQIKPDIEVWLAPIDICLYDVYVHDFKF